jgi:aspartyl-tRNA(Asn)/glutamyl-tRNA(Gln) amidotransferase subunit B
LIESIIYTPTYLQGIKSRNILVRSHPLPPKLCTYFKHKPYPAETLSAYFATDPLAHDGAIPLDEYDQVPQSKIVHIEKLQLEQDTGKSIHENNDWLLDMNRAGVALLEIVTAPDMTLPKEASALTKKLQSLLRTIGASYANLEEGSLRVDVNVSVHLNDYSLETERVELKNIATITGLTRALG